MLIMFSYCRRKACERPPRLSSAISKRKCSDSIPPAKPRLMPSACSPCAVRRPPEGSGTEPPAAVMACTTLRTRAWSCGKRW